MKYLLVLSNGGKKRFYHNYMYSKFSLDRKLSVEITVDDYPDSDKLIKLINSLSHSNFDKIFAIGGGSVIDIAKVLSVFLPIANQRKIKNLQEEDLDLFKEKKIHLTAVPTTSGTGAEATQFATIWDHINLKKYSIDHPSLLPEEFLLDSNFLNTLSYENFLYPVLDCVSHTLESIWNSNRNASSLILSEKSLKIISNEIGKLSKHNYKDIDFSKILLASNLAGQAINTTRTSIAHAISYEYTIKQGVPHGLACSFTIPKIHYFILKEVNDAIYKNFLKYTSKIIEHLESLELLNMVNKFEKDNTNIIDLSTLNPSRLNTFLVKPSIKTLEDFTNE
ncbi:MAG: hypothetical protein CMI90_05450 [Pelagibacteraceae bacterium]|nr:hypothetical protein [Pelagibacteraceae bacterium]